MAENKESFDGYLEKLALIADAVDELYEGKKGVVFQLNRNEFVKMRSILKGADEDKEQFKIDISGVEFIYLLDE
jgi:hypothetical protein